ncbi:hypothetical protein SAMN04487895_12721 [Paenibacillus sophorae]|uniref:Phage tail assembly protein n=1 Tax=Paenibacillus sophorae TaxID=1333845 RepID=A0A1H8VRW3_9BACL|nr:hypothetical protein [Paenibacillus sophorae]QWU15676.1 phage tail assembly protein [Paenibacillus sophorae]SEP18152.1 hypothetical protein SAMN04487895_12721 [Paenibacillus sophorae]
MTEEKKDQVQEGGAEVYTFARPVTFEGEVYEKITLDFEKLDGNDALAVLRQYTAETKKEGYAQEMDREYQAYFVAKAAGVHVGLIKAASAKDFTKLTLRARNFLLF